VVDTTRVAWMAMETGNAVAGAIGAKRVAPHLETDAEAVVETVTRENSAETAAGVPREQ